MRLLLDCISISKIKNRRQTFLSVKGIVKARGGFCLWLFLGYFLFIFFTAFFSVAAFDFTLVTALARSASDMLTSTAVMAVWSVSTCFCNEVSLSLRTTLPPVSSSRMAKISVLAA